MKGRRKKEKKKVGPLKEQNYPDWSDPSRAISYWTEALEQGFVPARAQKSLAEGLETCGRVPCREKIEALLGLTGDPLGRAISVDSAPEFPAAALADVGKGRLFLAGAARGGLVCADTGSGRKIWSLGPEALAHPGGMALSGEILFVCDRWNHRVLALAAADRAVLKEITQAGEGCPLDEPADAAVLEKGTDSGQAELWIVNRGGHNICRYRLDGTFLGCLGQRGLIREETIWRNTKPDDAPDPVFMEFPRSVSVARDLEGRERVFVWDSGNRRVLVFGTDGAFVRAVALETPGQSKALTCGQLVATDSDQGPCFLGIDDPDTALVLWSAHGDLLLRILLKESLFKPTSRAEAVRVVAGSNTGQPLSLITSKRAVVRLSNNIMKLSDLYRSRAVLNPEDPRWFMALWESLRDAGSGKQALKELWESERGGMKIPDMVQRMLDFREGADGSPSHNLARLDRLADDLAALGMSSPSSDLATQTGGHLASLAEKAERNLLEKARLPAEDTERWTKALTEVDLELFQNKGKKQRVELLHDMTLEEVRNLAYSASEAFWSWRSLSRALAGRPGAEPPPVKAFRLAGEAVALLSERQERLKSLEQELDFDREPSRITQQELTAINRATLATRAIERVTDALAEEIGSALNGAAIPGQDCQLADRLLTCARLAQGRGGWDELYRKLDPGQSPRPENSDRQREESIPEDRINQRLEKLINLVDSMEAYQKMLFGVLDQNKSLGRVFERQQEIFAVKVSLLSGPLMGVKKTGEQTKQLEIVLERAGALAEAGHKE